MSTSKHTPWGRMALLFALSALAFAVSAQTRPPKTDEFCREGEIIYAVAEAGYFVTAKPIKVATVGHQHFHSSLCRYDPGDYALGGAKIEITEDSGGRFWATLTRGGESRNRAIKVPAQVEGVDEPRYIKFMDFDHEYYLYPVEDQRCSDDPRPCLRYRIESFAHSDRLCALAKPLAREDIDHADSCRDLKSIESSEGHGHEPP